MEQEELKRYKVFTAKHNFSNDICYLKNSLAQLKSWICAASFIMCLTNGLAKVYFLNELKQAKENLKTETRQNDKEREQENNKSDIERLD